MIVSPLTGLHDAPDTPRWEVQEKDFVNAARRRGGAGR
jgi:hypothetical protein